ncbi:MULTISPECIES: hypothetical protein [unclassified Paenibacillus]|uniref:hypothetical protein n=1 Tax=unclassified Paenibacillus TaxID=185978 RepID=UPI00277E4E2F|nr:MULTISPECIES: hypothetical protein [unclassified Paenibacillus]MDQ0896345.1 hypothetical protein [Paenibacillus sp. V4I7]MDQ0914112.1 hypothetical protein [Paenibacillus sp. V4I5]
MKKKGFSSKVLVLLFVAFVAFNVFAVTSAFADTTVVPTMDNLKAGTSGTDVNKLVDGWVTNLRIIGIGLILIPIAVGAIMLGFSMGNAQKRGIAVACLLSAGLGIVVLAKMNSLAGWIVNQ